MTFSYDSLHTVDHVEAALEAACGALITLESAYPDVASGVYEVSSVHANVARAVHSLRHAIAELRHAHSSESSGLALGFVLKGDPSGAGEARRRGSQSKPRRTA